MTVSVIIPTYNSATFVGKAIDSALTQSLLPIEVILVDNNSTDNSLEVLEKYALQFPNLITVTTSKTQGPSAARNTGLQLAKGEWIQFLDSDDTLPPNKLEDQLRHCPPFAEWIVAGYREIDLSGNSEDFIPGNDLWMGLATGRGIGCTCSNLFKRSLLLAHSGYCEQLPDAEDHDLYFRLLSGSGGKAASPWVDQLIRCNVYDRKENKQSRHDLANHLQRRVELHQRLHHYLEGQCPDYYLINGDFLKAYLINNYRYWAAFDRHKAVDSAEQFFTSSVTWPASGAGILSPHVYYTYRLLGFRRAEWLRNFFR